MIFDKFGISQEKARSVNRLGVHLSFGSDEVGHELEWNLIGELVSIRLVQMAAAALSHRRR